MRKRWCRAWPLALGAAAGMALSGCLELAGLTAPAVPRTLAGLSPADGWVYLPVDELMTEGELEADAIAACLRPSCPGPAVVGLFRARGEEARLLAAIAREPRRLASALSRPTPAASRRSPPGRPAIVEATRSPDGHGLSVRLAAADGSRTAWGEARLRPGPGGGTVVLLALGEDRALVRRLVEAGPP